MAEARWLTVAEVATRLRASEETVRRWLRQGRLRGILPGGTKMGYRISEGELAQFLVTAASKTPGNPATPESPESAPLLESIGDERPLPSGDQRRPGP